LRLKTDDEPQEEREMFKGATVAARKPFSWDKAQTMGQDLVAKLGRTPSACWLFCEPGENMKDLLAGISSVLGTTNLVGCTTDGEISSAGFSTGSAVLGGIVSDEIRFDTASVTGLATDSQQAGRKLGQLLPPSARHIQLFSDGLTANGSALLRGMHEVFGPDVTISGGTAGDARAFKQTWQFIGDRVLSDSAVAIALSGDFRIGTGVQSGWLRVGIAKTVTRVDGNILYELDGESALAVYRRYLGPLADRLPDVGVEFPFGLLDETGQLGDDPVLRAPMAVSARDGSVTFAGEIPKGSTICLCSGGMTSSLLDSSAGAAEKALAAVGQARPKMTFFYSCMARKMLLGSMAGQESQRVGSVVGSEVPMLGFYTYGEFCPSRHGTECRLHNETATITIIA